VSVGAKSVNARVRGVDPSFGPMRNLIPSAGGRFIDEADLAEKRRVAFLGDELAKDLFGAADPIGRTVQINQSTFLVVGVMQAKVMMGMYSGPDKGQAAIPATTFRSMYTDARPGNMVYAPVSLQAGDQVKSEIYRVLGRKYRFDPEDRRALGIWDTRENQRVTENIAFGIQVFLGIIGALTLFVGGMGVANIMYAVVKERTREIGVKMALGARRGWITGPFLLEGLLYTFVGGLAGAASAIAIVTLLGLIPQEGAKVLEFLGKPTLSWPIGGATVAILGIAGLLAGYFPARRAAAIDPAATLRYE
jgi:putative ABC transport system permease protein